MMHNDINAIFHNDTGIAFLWKDQTAKKNGKIQLVFRDTGLLLNKKELVDFSQDIKKAIKTQPFRSDCKQNKNCRCEYE